jgi:hypothetical protein
MIHTNASTEGMPIEAGGALMPNERQEWIE